MGINGEGIGKTEGYTLFVKDAVIGDRVRVSIMKAKKGYAYAHLDKVLVPSPDRVTPPCPKAKACGGCQLQAMSYDAQLRYKESKVRNDLIRIGGFAPEYIDAVLKPIVGMNTDDSFTPVRYRGKTQFPVGRDKDGHIVTGFYAGHSHNIIPIDDCIIGAKEYSDITQIMRDHMRKYDIAPYDEASGTGLVRHILLRKGYATGELMTCLVLNRGKSSDGIYLTGQDELISALTTIENMTSVSVNLNRDRSNVIMGDKTVTIWGKDTIRDVITLCSVEKLYDSSHTQETEAQNCISEEISIGSDSMRYNISPKSFYQVNPIQTNKLYAIAVEYAGLTGSEIVWDLYCGIGTISLFMARRAGHVYGVEIVPEAVEDAKKNALDNGMDNVSFYTGRAEDIVITDNYQHISEQTEQSAILQRENAYDAPGIEHIYLPQPDTIVIDPPRKGCDPVLIDTILNAMPSRIVYVSCNPATLSRDLRTICDGGYDISAITPTDMFPHSVHVETVCLLGRRKPDDTIKVSVNMDDYYQIRDAEEAEKKPS